MVKVQGTKRSLSLQHAEAVMVETLLAFSFYTSLVLKDP